MPEWIRIAVKIAKKRILKAIEIDTVCVQLMLDHYYCTACLVVCLLVYLQFYSFVYRLSRLPTKFHSHLQQLMPTLLSCRHVTIVLANAMHIRRNAQMNVQDNQLTYNDLLCLDINYNKIYIATMEQLTHKYM